MDHLPQGITYAALGAIVLTMCGLMVWGVVQRVNKRSSAEGDLDTRLPLILDASLKPWQQLAETLQKINDEERAEKLRAQDEREAITKQFIEYSTQQDNIHRAEMQKIRDDHQASAERVHARLDECTRRDAENSGKLTEAMRRLEMLEQHDRATFNALRAGQQVQAAVPIAPTTFAVPSTGLTITPGVPG